MLKKLLDIINLSRNRIRVLKIGICKWFGAFCPNILSRGKKRRPLEEHESVS